MKKVRRSARIVDMTYSLASHPHRLRSLTDFKERYGAAKSSISEDLQIINDVFQRQGIGFLKTTSGASGGVTYIPTVRAEDAKRSVSEWVDDLTDSSRILPGGYLYLTDYLSQPRIVNFIGQMISAVMAEKKIDYVMTVETKGIPLAYATSQFLNVPFVIVRRDSRVTEGSVVSMNYVSGSTQRIQTMYLSRRSIHEGANVLIVDDFMKAGGTVKGMTDLLAEFQAAVAGICVFVESESHEERLVDNVHSVVKLVHVDVKQKQIGLQTGNLLNEL